jgi:hypothetical protein
MITSINACVTTKVDVDVDVEIQDLDDDELLACVEEARSRGLLGTESKDNRDVLETALRDPMSKRYATAIEGIEKAAFAGREDLLAAWQAARDGRWNDAICWLDKVVAPHPVPTMLPRKVA